MPEPLGRVHAFPVYASLEKKQVARNLRLNLPKEVRENVSFVVFRLESHPKQPSAKKRKVPYYANTGARRNHEHGSPADLRGMVTFAEAVRRFENSNAYDGIGFATLGRTPLTFIDLDNCFDPDTGEVNALAQELLSWGSYTEFSIGGKGLRIVLQGNLAQNGKNLHSGIELFCTRGFVTLTGMPFGSSKPVLVPNEEQIQRLKELVTFNERDPEEEVVNIPSPLDDDRIKDVWKAIKHIDPDLEYGDWVKIGQCLHSGSSDPDGRGFRLWVRWSAKGDKFANTSEEDMRRKWSGFHAGRGVTLATIFHIAKQYGYKGKRPQWAKEELGRIELGFGGLEDIEREELYPLAKGLFDNIGAYMLIGRSKVGKSRLIGAMMVGALTGGKFFDFKFERTCRILAMPLEERGQDVIDRLELYMLDPQDHKDQIMITDEKRIMAASEKYSGEMDYIEYLDQLLDQAKPDLVYLDTWIKLKAVWRNDPTSRAQRATEQDYEMSASLQELALKHHCVLLFSVHGSKRKTQQGGADIFDSIGTTSWAMAGCAGALVMSDMPNFNALDEDADAADATRRILSIRGRFKNDGDTHLLLENRPSGIITCLGDYNDTINTTRQTQFMRIIREQMANGAEWVTAAEMAEHMGITRRSVVAMAARLMRDAAVLDGMRLVSAHRRGYRLDV